MKRLFSSLTLGTVLTAGLAIVSPVSAQEISRSIVIQRDSKLGSETVAKGQYSLKFVDGKDGELVLLRGKHEVLKATYKLTTLDQPASNNLVVSTVDANGSYQLKRIEFKGKTAALVFDNTVAKAIIK
jgi:hypothetical protein